MSFSVSEINCKFCNQTLHDPIRLPCGNYICNVHIVGSKGNEMKCRFCRQLHEVPIDGWQVEEFVQELIKILQVTLIENEKNSRSFQSFSRSGSKSYDSSWNSEDSFELWNASEGREIEELKGHLGSVCSLAVLPNGNLASGSGDYSIKIWNVEEGTEIKTLVGHTDSVNSLVVLPNGYLVSGSFDNSIKISDIDQGKEISTLKVYSCFVLSHTEIKTLEGKWK